MNTTLEYAYYSTEKVSIATLEYDSLRRGSMHSTVWTLK